MDHQFRNAVFGGFNRQDVLDYLETLARENAQKRQELEQSIGRAEGERDELCAQKQALEEQKRALEGEKEELLRSVQRSQSELAASASRRLSSRACCVCRAVCSRSPSWVRRAASSL